MTGCITGGRLRCRRGLAAARALLVAAAVAAALAGGVPSALAQTTATLPGVVVTAPRPDKDLQRRRATASDSARLLDGVPGVSLYEAGGVSALPAIHGMADERIRVQVDGMDLAAACPNHMNSPLSYIDPARVQSTRVLAGITPVSAGGDSIAGTIQVTSAPPRFAAPGEEATASGLVSGSYRSNGRAWGYALSAEWVGHDAYLTLGDARRQSRNYRAGADFKAAGAAAPGREWLDGDEVGSSAYRAHNQDVGVAVRFGAHLLQLTLGQQHIPYELYPNQRMDMTGNDSTQVNLRYTGQFDWGEFKGRAFVRNVRHAMDMGENRHDYGTGMPMDTRSRTRGGSVQADVRLSAADELRVGAEVQTYYLYDWWSPVGTGMMAPATFWNVDYGTRARTGAFAEWEARWAPAWTTQFGIRRDVVKADAGPVQGYNGDPIWAEDAAAFNARSRQRTDRNWDITLLARHTPAPTLAVELGLARKSRAPSLYERYPWSNQSMATLMNNFVGDGNGYIGNPDLRPEVAHTLSLSADWHAADDEAWGLRATGYYTRVADFVDAERCTSTLCGGEANARTTTGFVNLRYANQSARLMGVDLSARLPLGRSAEFGGFDATGLVSYVSGVNLSTSDRLYHVMPPNLRLALTRSGTRWTNAAEFRSVAAKRHVSQVRNEVPTAGYALLELRSSYEQGPLRIDLSVDNAFNRAYAQPLGGAYVGQGASMATTSLPWGVTVPGRGRSLDVSLSVRL